MKLLLLVLSLNAYAYVDLSLQFSQTKRESITTDASQSDFNVSSRTLGIVWAWYIWEYTALEFNYSQSKEVQTNNRDQVIDPTLTINQTVTTTETEVKGVGLKLNLAKRQAFVIPSVSAGYALLTTGGEASYEYTLSGTPTSVSYDIKEETSSSSYLTAGLRFNFSKFFGVNISARSIMEDFELSQYDKNIIYLAGLSWVF